LVIFILYDSRRIWRWVLSLLPTPAAARLNEAGRASWVALTGFVHGTFLIAVIHATVIGTTLYLLGVPAYLSLALLVFLGSFVPLIGAVVAGGISVIFTLGTQGLVPALILLGVLLLENELEAHVLQPFVVGRYVRLHPVAIVLVLALGSVVGGLAGVLLAVPLVGAARAAWGPLNGRESVVPVGEPSRLSRLSRWLRRTWESVVRRSPGTSPRRTRR
jgi:predicted PurR-regulated permease PerM